MGNHLEEVGFPDDDDLLPDGKEELGQGDDARGAVRLCDVKQRHPEMLGVE